MKKEEFLQKLSAELSLNVSQPVLLEQFSYYEAYISGEVEKGKAEEEVVSELGDPRLLARTITEAAEAGGDKVAIYSPFRYTEEDINYNTDEEDLKYSGVAEDSYEEAGSFFKRKQNARDRRNMWDSGSAEEARAADYDSADFEGSDFRSGPDLQSVKRTGGSDNSAPNFHVYRFGNTGCIILTICFILTLVLAAVTFATLLQYIWPAIAVVAILWILKGIMDR